MCANRLTTGAAPRFPTRIAHCDLDTFFVAVERLRDPQLVGKPVLVGGRGPRSVVASASYEARAFGCHSAQPMAQALRACPEATVVPPDFTRYRAASEAFHALLRDASPAVESVGLDEAFADLTGLGADGMGARATAEAIRARVRAELGLAVSIGIAGGRTTAKVTSDRAKPDGLLDVPAGGDAAFLAPLPLRELPLAGPRLVERLALAGVRTIGQVAVLDAGWLVRQFGAAGHALSERARGIDATPVRGVPRAPVSVSREVTFGEDVRDPVLLDRVLEGHAERIGADLRRAGRRARTVMLKVRWLDFTTVTRSHTLARPAQSTAQLAAVGRALRAELVAREGERPVRLIGLAATNLVDEALQLRLEERATPRDERLDRALDAIRERYGGAAVRRGARSRGRG
ncbi:MAG: DNA polymerase IV [Chloroflexi bacterium]|nr:DNA polymerase IV [Chloroflexota bacterium]